MIILIRKILLVFGFFFSAGILLAQGSLEVLLTAIETNNPRLQALEKDYLAALKWKDQVSQLEDPVFQTGYYLSRPETRLGPQILQLGISQSLPWKGTIKARKDLMHSKAEVKKESVGIANLNLQYLVKKAWLELYEIQEQQNIIQEYIQVYSVLEKVVLTKIENGSAPLGDALNIQLVLLELNQQLQILEKEKRIPEVEINKILNRDLNTSISINEKLKLLSWPEEASEWQAKIEATHPLFQQYLKEGLVAENEKKLNHLENKPKFTVGLNYVVLSPLEGVLLTDNGRNVLMPNLKFNLPIQKQKYHAKNQEMDIQVAMIEDKKQEAINEFSSMLELAKVKMETAELKNELFISQLRTLDAAIEVGQTRYSTDSQGLESLLELHNEMISYELKILDSVMDSYNAKFEIERILMN